MKHLIMVCALLASVTAVSAQTPYTISQQGFLMDDSGQPMTTGSYSITFRLYSGDEGGDALWTETNSVDVDNGQFNARLGAVNGLNAVDFDQPLFLGVAMDDGAEMSPRLPFTSVPYALMANHVPAGSITEREIANGAINGSSFEEGSINITKLNSEGGESGQMIGIGPEGTVRFENPGQGPDGPKGDVGPKGAVGDAGPQGDPGDAGVKGDQGPKGPVGPVGDAGPAGPVGDKGPDGTGGTVGPKGETGDKGPDGDPGSKGDVGAKGDQGPTGAAGAKGDDGNAGATGAKGDKGAVGPKGPVGDAGPAGPAGPNDITAVLSGAGISGGASSGNASLKIDPGYFNGRYVNEGQANSVTSAMLQNGAIQPDDFASGSFTLPLLSPSGGQQGQVIRLSSGNPQWDYPQFFSFRAAVTGVGGNNASLNHPSVTGNPGAILSVVPNFDTNVYVNCPIGIYYFGGGWRVFCEDQTAMPGNASFTVIVYNP